MEGPVLDARLKLDLRKNSNASVEEIITVPNKLPWLSEQPGPKVSHTEPRDNLTHSLGQRLKRQGSKGGIESKKGAGGVIRNRG